MCSRRLLVVSALVGVILGMESRRGSAEKAQPAAVPHVAPNTAANHAPATPTAVRKQLLVDLLRYGARVEVSSQVRNAAFAAAGLVDGRPATVWNSQTGRLVGEWIEVTLPAEVRLREIQLIVGNTAPGRKGQDWFAMNPRIKAASVWVDGRKRGVVKFDTNLRSPQPLSVDVAEATTVRIVVDEVVMGTKRDWKEVCVGDLIVRGESNGRARTDSAPGVLTNEALLMPLLPHPENYCEQFETDALAARSEREPDDEDTGEIGNVDAPGKPACVETAWADGDEDRDTDGRRTDPWQIGTVYTVDDDIYELRQHELLLTTAKGTFRGDVVAVKDPTGSPPLVAALEAREVLAGYGPELLIWQTHDNGDKALKVCALRRERPYCTDALPYAAKDWEANVKVARGQIMLSPKRGKVPAYAHSRKLVWW